MKVDGKKIQEEIKEELKEEFTTLGKPLKLSIVQVGEDEVTDRFVRAKQKFADGVGVEMDLRKFPSDTGEQELIMEIQ